MLIRFLLRSFLNQKRAALLMVAAVTVGTAVVASLLTISLDIERKLARELRSFGANIIVAPRIEGLADISGQRRFLREDDIRKARTIFWRHNIVALVPFLELKSEVRSGDKKETIDAVGTWYEKNLPEAESEKGFLVGVRSVSPSWVIAGNWFNKDNEIVLGTSLAQKLGHSKDDSLMLDGKVFLVSGILDTGGDEDNKLFMDLGALQALKNMHGKISYVEVSALTTPMDEFAYRSPETMSRAEYEKWYCTGYVTAIAKQLEEVFYGSKAKPVWPVAEREGRLLGRIRFLIYFLSLSVVLSTALGVSATMIMGLLRRTGEIGLMKAMGADNRKIAGIFISESIVLGLTGGLAGYILSRFLTGYIGMNIFGSVFREGSLLLPVTIGCAFLISTLGVMIPVRKALKIKPAIVLKGLE